MRLAPKIALVFVATAAMSCVAAWPKFNDQSDSPPQSPLAFAAADGHYFPAFIMDLFPMARQFTVDHPSLSQARAGILIIEVKPLSAGNTGINEGNLAWSDDGTYLGFEAIEGQRRRILLRSLRSPFAQELKVAPDTRDLESQRPAAKAWSSYNAGLRWAPRSHRFAFMSNGGIGDFGIYVGAVGEREHPITDGRAKYGFASWSPNAHDLAFVSTQTGTSDIFVKDLATDELSQVTSGALVSGCPEWLPNGHGLVFASGDALVHEIWRVERAGIESPWSKAVALTMSGLDNLRPTVAPNGRLLAFYSGHDAVDGVDAKTVASERSWDLVVIAADPGKAYDAKDLQASTIAHDVVLDLNTGPAWSPDSRKIFFVKRDHQAANPIIAYDLATGHSSLIPTGTRMNHDILISSLGLLSFRTQVGAWDRVYIALTNQGRQLQGIGPTPPLEGGRHEPSAPPLYAERPDE